MLLTKNAVQELIHAFHSPFYLRTGIKSPYKKIRKTCKLESDHE